jgi:hypothetical protein
MSRETVNSFHAPQNAAHGWAIVSTQRHKLSGYLKVG